MGPQQLATVQPGRWTRQLAWTPCPQATALAPACPSLLRNAVNGRKDREMAGAPPQSACRASTWVLLTDALWANAESALPCAILIPVRLLLGGQVSRFRREHPRFAP